MTSVIQLAGVSKRYGSVEALRSVNLTVDRGEVFALLGPNGAGKTTLMELVTGIRRPTGGSLEVLDANPWDAGTEWRRRIGYLPQEVVVVEYLSGVEYIELIMELYDVDRAVTRLRVPEALDFFDLKSAREKRLGTYSTGMKKKIVLCTLFLCRPDLLVLDEPFEGLDPHAIRGLQQWIGEMAAAGKTLVVSSHTLPFVEKVASKVAIIDEGEIKYTGPVVSPAPANGEPDRGALEKMYFSLVKRAEK